MDGNQLTFESSINEIYNWYSSNTDWLFYDINNILKNREKGFEMIPVVIVHEDYNNFLKSSIEITGEKQQNLFDRK